MSERNLRDRYWTEPWHMELETDSMQVRVSRSGKFAAPPANALLPVARQGRFLLRSELAQAERSESFRYPTGIQCEP